MTKRLCICNIGLSGPSWVSQAGTHVSYIGQRKVGVVGSRYPPFSFQIWFVWFSFSLCESSSLSILFMLSKSQLWVLLLFWIFVGNFRSKFYYFFHNAFLGFHFFVSSTFSICTHMLCIWTLIYFVINPYRNNKLYF